MPWSYSLTLSHVNRLYVSASDLCIYRLGLAFIFWGTVIYSHSLSTNLLSTSLNLQTWSVLQTSLALSQMHASNSIFQDILICTNRYTWVRYIFVYIVASTMFIQGKHVVLKIPFEIKFFSILPRMNKYPFSVIRLAMLTSLVYRLPSECYSVRPYFDYCCE